MPLTANTPRTHYEGNYVNLGVEAAARIFQGAVVGDNGSGFAQPLVAGDPFLGFAELEADNRNGVNGAIEVRCKHTGMIELDVSGYTGGTGVAVYASDDGTFTTTATSNTFIGRTVRQISGTRALVSYNIGVLA